MDEQIENRGLTRGGLIRAGAVAALAAGAGVGGRALANDGRAGGAAPAGAALAASGLSTPTGGPAYLRHETYVPLIGTEFRVHRPGARALRVQLIEATKGRGVGESFSLLFRGHARAAMESGTFRIEHRALGQFELFVSPVGRGVKGLDLEAVVNRIAT